jgi:hypothetical protein
VPNVRPLLAASGHPVPQSGERGQLRRRRKAVFTSCACTAPILVSPPVGLPRSETIMPVREKYSRNIGIWTGEAPQPNEIWHMWNYQDTNERARVRAESFRDPEWLNFVRTGEGTIVEMQNTMLIPTDFSGLK